MKIEDLVVLYGETKSKYNQNIIFNKLFNSLLKRTMKICYFYINTLIPNAKEDFLEELIQESKICLFQCINKFKFDKNARFATFYYKCLKNHISNVFHSKFNVFVNEMPDTPVFDWLNMSINNVEYNAESRILYSILDKNLSNIKYSSLMHENVFKEYLGFKKDANGDDSFASLSRKYGISRVAIKKICDKYFKLLKNQIQQNGDIEKLKAYL